MAYANTQKNGNMAERVKLNTWELQMTEIDVNNFPAIEQKGNSADADHSCISYPHIGMGIIDDIDDEAVFGRNRHGKRRVNGHER